MLTDDDKKSAYERYGADGPQVEHHHRGPRRGHHGDFYDDDINPEDIFNMFFGGMPPGKSAFCWKYSNRISRSSYGRTSSNVSFSI